MVHCCGKNPTNFLAEHLQMQPLPLYPCLLKSPDSKCLMLLHVDDILVVCGKDYLEDSLLKALSGKYKVSAEVMQFLGDSVTFLKRRLVLEAFDQMIIYPHPKDFTRLFDLVGAKKTWKPKNVPAHSQILECFETAELSSDGASVFRSAVGILVYLSCDMVECQWTIRHLAQSMSKPTEKAWIELRHLVQYLLGCMSYGLLMHYKSDYDGSDLSLKVLTDSDWASNKGTRKSVSARCIMAKNCLLHSARRNQGLIALSFPEAETSAGTSGECDGLFLAKCWEFLLEVSITPKLLIDSSAGRYILGRSGCGRVRHLSTPVLWVQQKVEKRELLVGPVASSEKVADIGTKKLGVVTTRILMNMLGVYDSEKNELVGQHEIYEKHSKQAIRLLSKKQGLNSVKMNQLILASLFVPTTSNALSPDLCDMVAVAEPSMASISWSIFDGSYTIDVLYMQLSYMTACMDTYFHGPFMLVGTLAVLSFCVGLLCRLVFGGENGNLIGRAFVLSGDLAICLSSPLLYKWIDVRINWLHGQHRRLLKLKDKPAIRDVQNRMIALYESKRELDGIVYGFFTSETAAEKYKRYQSCGIEECSDPEYWQQINCHNGGDELQQMQSARERALQAARDAWHHAEVNSDWQRMEECQATIDRLTLL